MNVLFLGSLCHERQEGDLILKSRAGLQNSIIRFQWNLIRGIEVNLGRSVDIVNSLPVGTYPRYYKEPVVRTSAWSHAEGATDVTLGIINLPVIKQAMLATKAKREITRWIEENQGERLCIVMYDLLLPYLVALRGVRKSYPDVVTCSVVADLPNEYGYEKGDRRARKQLRRSMGEVQLREAKKMHCYGLLTEQMKHPLGISDDDYVVIEGISDPDLEYREPTDDKKRIISYMGVLSAVYQLDVLLDAFMGIEDDGYELWLCGTGSYVPEILRRSVDDPRIRYFGYLTRKQVTELQLRSTVLVNPRQNVGEYTKYSFPSKTIECLAAGRPVVGYRLDGVPDEYYRFIVCPEDNSAEKLRETVTRICNLSLQARREMGELGRRFVVDKKNPAVQCGKLTELLDAKLLEACERHTETRSYSLP